MDPVRRGRAQVYWDAFLDLAGQAFHRNPAAPAPRDLDQPIGYPMATDFNPAAQEPSSGRLAIRSPAIDGAARSKGRVEAALLTAQSWHSTSTKFDLSASPNGTFMDRAAF